MAAQVFLAAFYSSRRPSQIGPTADFDCAAIPPLNFPARHPAKINLLNNIKYTNDMITTKLIKTWVPFEDLNSAK